MSQLHSHFFRPVVESLEERLVPYALTSYKWANMNVSVSMMPDSTLIGTAHSDLFTKYTSKFSAATWQREFARALQTWASVTPLNFHYVTDTGAASGTTGLVQGDSRFGDIRLGAYATSGTYLAFSYYPYRTTTRGGDVALNSRTVYNIGTTYDLYSVLLHETGHSLGLGHSNVYGSVLYPLVKFVYKGLTTDDLTGIRALYGARPADIFDVTRANNSLATATPLTVSNGGVNITADLTTAADIDFYRITVPPGSNGTLTVAVDPRHLSLLIPKLWVFGPAQNLLTYTQAGAAYGSMVQVTLSGLVAGQTYTIAVDGPTDVFGIGAYRLNAQFGGFTTTVAATTTTSSSTTSTGGTATPALALPGDEEDHDHDHDADLGDYLPGDVSFFLPEKRSSLTGPMRESALSQKLTDRAAILPEPTDGEGDEDESLFTTTGTEHSSLGYATLPNQLWQEIGQQLDANGFWGEAS